MDVLRDPFYRQICQALEGHLDDKVFERCMGDLLRPDFPGLVPVPGGGDSGFDGVIPDQEEAFPLVCTTGKDVERNLTRSLDSIVKRGWTARKVALATSQALTPQRRLGLFDQAKEKNFRMMQVLDQRALADRLYRSSRWCKELLGLAGQPSPLSVVPITRRPLIDLEPIGRAQDLGWLLQIAEDRVLAGEPGSGKTHLVRHLMLSQSWPALFLVSRDFDMGAIAGGIRDLLPKIIVVDDAHENPGDLTRLARLRKETGAGFHILAITWKGAEDEIVTKLGVSPEQVRRLQLLTRDEIVEVFKQAGVRTDNETLRLLVNQASNRPGLAATIASLWLQDRWNELLDGTALSRDLLSFFHEFVGKESTDVLASFSLGGDRGMTLESVGEFLGLARHDLRRVVVGLAAGGAVSEVDGDTLAVWPRELRNPLLRVVFFPDSAVRHPYRELLKSAPNRRSAIETLVSAKLFHVPVPGDELRELVAEAGSLAAWRGMAYLGEADALWVLEHYTGDIVDVAGAALSNASEAAILRLLQRAESASGQPHSHVRHPMRILQDWVQDLVDIPLDEMVRRRKLLAKISKKYLQAGGARSVGLQGICLALSPSMEGSSSDPGAGRTINIRWGLLPLEQVREVASIWPEVRGDFDEIEAEDWQHLSSVLWHWIHPSYASKGRPVSEGAERFMKDFAATILRDLAPSAQGKPGLAAKIRELAQKIGLVLSLEPEPVFDRLFPSTDDWHGDRRRHEAEWKSSLDELARQWAVQEPAEVAKLLAGYEKQAQQIGRAWPPRGDSEVCRRLAILSEVPEDWLEALLAQGTSGVMTGPFLERIVETRREGWELHAERFLGLERQHAWSAVEAVLRLLSPPPDLLKTALGRLSELPQLLESLCMTRQVPVETLRTLFQDPRWEVALTAAVGEWNADREGGVRPEVAADWRFAILGAKPGAREYLNSGLRHWLGVILAKDPTLAFDWLVARLRDSESPQFIAGDDLYGAALSAMTRDQRLRLVEQLAQNQAPVGFVGLLVGKDPEVYADVLSSEKLRQRHLEPLGFLPDNDWLSLALLALEAEHEPDEIVQASLWTPQGRVISGSGSETWQKHEQAFARFAADPSTQVREIARRGQQLAAEEYRKAEECARQFAIRGRYV